MRIMLLIAFFVIISVGFLQAAEPQSHTTPAQADTVYTSAPVATDTTGENRPLDMVLGMLATGIAWLLSAVFKLKINRRLIQSALGVILDIIQNIKTNPETADLADHEKKLKAIEQVNAALTPKQTGLLKKVFGSIGGAIEYVFHNKTILALGKAATALI